MVPALGSRPTDHPVWRVAVAPLVEASDNTETVGLQNTVNMENRCAESRTNLVNRLRRLEGQVRGVRRMLEEERNCKDIVIQMAAVRGAAYQISVMVVQEYAVKCLEDPNLRESPEEMIAKMVSTLVQMPR